MSGTDSLARVVGVGGAILLGLGSILGTGLFVSIGIGAGVAGPAVVLAVFLASFVATFNGLSSAQLAAAHPVSGGTYEYGYRYLRPWLGFTAGWMFLCAKSASAATAALGFAGYLLAVLDVPGALPRIVVAELLVLALVAIVARGMRASNRTNAFIVSVTLLALAAFVAAGLPRAAESLDAHFAPFLGSGPDLLEATALMFVAYTGYGRIATLGEEIREPARNIPRAIVATLVVTMLLYVSVAFVAVGAEGAPALAAATESTAAPLAAVAGELGPVLTLAGLTAMVGVLLNLILGLSRVLLAMARRRDVPGGLARVDARTSSPTRAVLVMGAVVGGLVLLGDVRTTWSFSAFTVLVYYALTNLAALRLPPEARRFPRAFAWAGLASCLGLAAWIEPAVLASGLALIAAGLVWHRVARARAA